MKKKIGKCALCGKTKELTFEHIPPRAAFNKVAAKALSGEVLMESKSNEDRYPWDTDGLHYTNLQRGMGGYTLCQSCNNLTGTLYGDAYADFSKIIATALNSETNEPNRQITVVDVYPNRIAKQVLSMFCSINPESPKLDELRKLVLSKDLSVIDKQKYKLCMYTTKSENYVHTGITGMLRIGPPSMMMLMSNITAYPLGFILYFDPIDDWDYKGVDITKFLDFSYEDKGSISFPWIIYEVNNYFPEDFRTKEEIIKCINENRHIDY